MSGSRPFPRATIADVARRAGVSEATVSRVLNRTAPVAEETAALVWAAIAELSYVPTAAARNLARGRTSTLGLLLPEIGNAFFSPLVRGIEAVARESGFDLLVYAAEPITGRAAGFSRRIGERNTDGVLIFADSLDEKELARLYELRFPTVLLLQPPPASLTIPYVSFENKKGARALVDHLVEAHGCRRIAFLRGPHGNSDSAWRERGYRESLAAHGIAFDPALVGTGGFNEVQARAAVEQWLSQGIVFDAVFAGDDESAYGALQAFERRGVRVPEDVAIVGFDDVYYSQFLSPPLTTARAPIEEAGRLAAGQLLQLIHTGHATAPEILLPTELVVRRSCGCRWQRAQALP